MIIKDEDEFKRFAWELGRNMHGGECVELCGDVGVGKTTFTQGFAEGLDVSEKVVSPSYTIKRSYLGRDDIVLNHYDFYRLQDPGIMKREVQESLSEKKNVTVIEWADTIANVLPPNRIVVEIKYVPDHPAWREIKYDFND